MARRTVDAKVAKARRQKKIAIGGSLVLVLVLVLQVPKTLKMMNPEKTAAPPAATTATPPAASGPGSTTVPAAPGGAGVPIIPTAAVAALPDSTAAPEPGRGQLVSFERFASKDPFFQQVSVTGGSTGTEAEATDLGTLPAKPGGLAAGTGGAADKAGAGADKAGTTEGAGETGFTPGTETVPAATPLATATTISINGEAEAVAVGANFPAAGPLFMLAKLGKDGKSVEIGVAGGTLATGAPTVTLMRGKPLTLMNTADGTRYTLVLLAVEGF